MAAALVNQPAQLLLAMTEIGDQSLKALRLFNRVEIGALDVFNQRKLEARGIVKFADDRRNLVKSRRLRRPPAPLAGNDRSAEHTSELQSPIRTSYAVFC